MLNLLAQVEGFRVAGRTSAFSFKGRNEDLRLIGTKLDVENVLEGSVRKQGDRIRVTAQLVKVADGYHLWSDTYDRRLDDVFAIQTDIATQVVAELRKTLLGGTARGVAETVGKPLPTSNVEAYSHYLRGQHSCARAAARAWRRRSRSSSARSNSTLTSRKRTWESRIACCSCRTTSNAASRASRNAPRARSTGRSRSTRTSASRSPCVRSSCARRALR